MKKLYQNCPTQAVLFVDEIKENQWKMESATLLSMKT
jgi:hypothetical protein